MSTLAVETRALANNVEFREYDEVLARCIPVSREVFRNHLDRFAARVDGSPCQ